MSQFGPIKNRSLSLCIHEIIRRLNIIVCVNAYHSVTQHSDIYN